MRLQYFGWARTDANRLCDMIVASGADTLSWPAFEVLSHDLSFVSFQSNHALALWPQALYLSAWLGERVRGIPPRQHFADGGYAVGAPRQIHMYTPSTHTDLNGSAVAEGAPVSLEDRLEEHIASRRRRERHR